MGFFGRSMAEDVVDNYNHTWAVGLLLMLTMVSWLLPLSLVFQNISNQPTNMASCWCPQQFTSSHINYVNRICGAAYKKFINDDNDDGSEYMAKLHKMPSTNFTLDSNLSKSSDIGQVKNDQLGDISKNMTGEPSDISQTDIKYFISFTTPVTLLVLVICLKLPHIIWILLSSFVGINVKGALETMKSSQSLDIQSRRQMKKDLSSAVSEYAKATSNSTSILYILFKILMVISAVGCLVTTHNLLQQAQNLKKDDSSRKMIRDSTLLCNFAIQSLLLMNRYSVQCLFSADSDVFERETLIMTTYKALYTILMVLFLVLGVINMISGVLWSLKLLLQRCRQRVLPNSTQPMDIYLLLYMAQENLGNLVAKDLAENLAAKADGKKTLLEVSS